MKVVYFGNNLFSSCLKYLLDEGHQLLRVYKNSAKQGSSIIDKLCEDNSIAKFEHKPTASELSQLIAQGAEMFIVAEYSYLIPVTKVKYAINIHPTLLPNGRGPTPLPYLLKLPEFSGVTIHKISEVFDSGDIVLQAKVSQSSDETLTTLMMKMHLESTKLLKVFLGDIDNYYQTAIPQLDYTYWPKINAVESVLDWNLSIKKIQMLKRSFGHIGLIVKLNNALWRASHVELFEYDHELQPGNVVFEDNSLLAVTCLDGVVSMHKKSICQPNM